MRTFEEMKRSILIDCFAECKISAEHTAKQEPQKDELQESFNSFDFPDSVDFLEISQLVQFDDDEEVDMN